MKVGDLVKTVNPWMKFPDGESIGVVIEAKIMRPLVVLWLGNMETSLHHPRTIKVVKCK